MTVSAAAGRRLRWMNFPGAVLVVLLQRTPVMRVAAVAEEIVLSSPIGAVMRSAFAGVAAFGAVHSLAGATQFVIAPGNSVSGTTGTAITAVAFAVTGATPSPGSYRIAGLPPGLTVPGASSGVINATSGSISGTPTVAGTFNASITAYQFTDAQGGLSAAE